MLLLGAESVLRSAVQQCGVVLLPFDEEGPEPGVESVWFLPIEGPEPGRVGEVSAASGR